MLSNLMQDQQKKLIKSLQEKRGRIQPEVVTALALLDILDLLGDIRNPAWGGSQDS